MYVSVLLLSVSAVIDLKRVTFECGSISSCRVVYQQSSTCVDAYQQSLFSSDSCAVARWSSALTLWWARGGGLSPSPLPLPLPLSSATPFLSLPLSSPLTFLSSASSMCWSWSQRRLNRSFSGIHWECICGSPPDASCMSAGSTGSLFTTGIPRRTSPEEEVGGTKKGGGAGALNTSSSKSSSGWRPASVPLGCRCFWLWG